MYKDYYFTQDFDFVVSGPAGRETLQIKADEPIQVRALYESDAGGFVDIYLGDLKFIYGVPRAFLKEVGPEVN
jgi:hypothetical protein